MRVARGGIGSGFSSHRIYSFVRNIFDGRGVIMVLGIAACITWMTANLARFMWGRAMVALRDSTVAAPSVAVPIYPTKLMVFVFNGFTAGISGGLYATSQSYITPDAFHRTVYRRCGAGRHSQLVGPLANMARFSMGSFCRS
jgi:ABC-type branched-subunit amino acid transport system permease subunit